VDYDETVDSDDDNSELSESDEENGKVYAYRHTYVHTCMHASIKHAHGYIYIRKYKLDSLFCKSL